MKTEQVDRAEEARSFSRDAVRYFQTGKKQKTPPKRCPYSPGTECQGPGTLEICDTCPFGYAPCIPVILKNIYKKIIGHTINLLNREISFRSIFNPRP